MDVTGEVLLQLFNKNKLRNGTKIFLELKFFEAGQLDVTNFTPDSLT